MSLNKIINDFVESSGKSITSSGYMILEDGLIIQWGTCTFGNAGTGLANVTFPLTFPNSIFSISGLPDATNNISVVESMNYTLLTNSSVQFVCGMNTSLYNGSGRWIAIGY